MRACPSHLADVAQFERREKKRLKAHLRHSIEAAAADNKRATVVQKLKVSAMAAKLQQTRERAAMGSKFESFHIEQAEKDGITVNREQLMLSRPGASIAGAPVAVTREDDSQV